MPLTEREQSLMVVVADVLKEQLGERDKKIEQQQQHIDKLYSEVEGLISLLGEK